MQSVELWVSAGSNPAAPAGFVLHVHLLRLTGAPHARSEF